MSTKHTPGPWQLIGGSEICTTGKSILTRICVMPHHGNGKSETGEANARLIAAAPELLISAMFMCDIAFRRMDTLDKDDIEQWEKARAAIAKATNQ